MPSLPPRLHLPGIFQQLADHNVRYVIVGGVAARLQGTPYVTGDLDIVPDVDPANLTRLASALSGDSTRKKPADSTEYLPHPVVGPEEFYADYMAMYLTVNGPVDVLIELPGVGSFDKILRGARRYDIPEFGVTIHVAELGDIIRSKEHAGRSKDFAVLPVLYEAAKQLASEPDDYALSAEALNVDLPSESAET